MVRKILFLLLVANVLTSSHAQSNQNQYLEAKRIFNLGNYRDAMGSFQSLSEDEVFGSYASFYYALSAYHQELPKVALDMWKQILKKYPNWDQLNEVHFWLSKCSFENERYIDGFLYLESLDGKEASLLLNDLKPEVNLEQLDQLQQANPDHPGLAKLFFELASQVSYDQRDNERLLAIAAKFDLNTTSILSKLPFVRKDKYAVAVVLPFLFDSLGNSQSVIRNKIIFDLYQGMILAEDSLTKLSIPVEVFPYDTKRSEYATKSLILSGQLDNADVIIGPLYTGPIQIASKYSIEKDIPIINPVTSNDQTLQNNQYGFLLKPSYSTQGKMAAKYAASQFTKNKNAFVFFEDARDQIVAKAYKEQLEKDSFNIILFDELTSESGLKLQLDFTEQFEEVLDFDSLSQDQIDSIVSLPNRFIRSRLLRDENTGRVVRNYKGEDELEYYEMKYVVPEDTIGHVFLASSSNLLANNIISLAEVRRDTIGIIGYGDLIEFSSQSYEQLERLGVSMIHTDYFRDKERGELEKIIRKRLSTEPSKYHLIGFELIMQLGRLFEANGKHFQKGMLAGKYIEGFIMNGLMYGPFKDNQIVPIVKIEELEITVQN